jgi:hypothetical protein
MCIESEEKIKGFKEDFFAPLVFVTHCCSLDLTPPRSLMYRRRRKKEEEEAHTLLLWSVHSEGKARNEGCKRMWEVGFNLME